MNANQLSLNRLMRSRSILHQRIVEKQEIADSAREASGQYIGHDCKTGNDLIRTASGQIISARAISTGMAAFGETCWATLPLGTSQPITDRMPV